MKITLDLVINNRVYLKLNKKYVAQILESLDIPNLFFDKPDLDQLYRFKSGHKISLYFLMILMTSLNKPIDNVENNIALITSVKNTNVGIKNPKFPIDFTSKDGIRFIAAIMGDGELNSQLNVRYNNQDKKLIDLVLNSAKNLFGDVDYKLYYRKDKTYQLHFPKIVGIISSILGIKPGRKTVTNYGIPAFIFNLNHGRQSVFIRQFFNDEGNVRLKDRRLQVKQTALISVSKQEAKKYPTKYAHNVLIDLQRLLLGMGIDSKISLGSYRNDRVDWELSIYRIENLKKFQNLIGFDSNYKSEALDKAIKSYKFPSAARNKRLDYALDCAKKSQQKYGFITKHLLAKISKRSLKTATYYVVDLKKKGLLICVEKPKDKSGHLLPRKYNLVES